MPSYLCFFSFVLRTASRHACRCMCGVTSSRHAASTHVSTPLAKVRIWIRGKKERKNEKPKRIKMKTTKQGDEEDKEKKKWTKKRLKKNDKCKAWSKRLSLFHLSHFVHFHSTLLSSPLSYCYSFFPFSFPPFYFHFPLSIFHYFPFFFPSFSFCLFLQKFP